MRAIRILLPLSLVAAGLVAGGCSRSGENARTDVPEDKLAATVEDWQLTREQLEDFLSRLPEQQRRRFDSPEGRAELALRLMQEEMSYREAKRLKLQDQEDVRKQIDDATRTILVTAYLRDYVDNKARPSDEEMHRYYEENADQFTTLPTIRAQHIFSTSKSKLDDIKERIIDGGEKFTTMAHLYSEDAITKPDGGDLGYFNPGGYIRGVGYSETFTNALESMEIGKVYGPIKWDQGYSLVRVNARTDAELRPFDDVKDQIESTLSRERLEDTRATHFAEVEKKYQTRNLMQESYDSVQRGPQELFDYAQSSHDPQKRIDTFQEIVDKFPDDAHAPQAMFMIGFVYAEEMHDYVMAERSLNAVVQKYPDSEMAETARWMLENLDKPLPKFENLDDLNKQIGEQGN